MAINIEEYINENEDELIDNDYDKQQSIETIEQCDNEDTEDDEFNDMLHDEYEKELVRKNCKGGEKGGEEGNTYYFNLLNIFIKYYNDKYNKNENFFTNIKDIDKDTTPQMELFYEMIIEYNLLKEEGEVDIEEKGGICNKEDVYKLIKNPKYQQVYCLELPNKECIYTASLLICLNYLIEHNNSDITDCKIYFLK